MGDGPGGRYYFLLVWMCIRRRFPLPWQKHAVAARCGTSAYSQHAQLGSWALISESWYKLMVERVAYQIDPVIIAVAALRHPKGPVQNFSDCIEAAENQFIGT